MAHVSALICCPRTARLHHPSCPHLLPPATQADFYCRGADCGELCTELRHHCLKRPDLDLCPKCFKGDAGGGQGFCVGCTVPSSAWGGASVTHLCLRTRVVRQR